MDAKCNACKKVAPVVAICGECGTFVCEPCSLKSQINQLAVGVFVAYYCAACIDDMAKFQLDQCTAD
jgi:hypothetical protein